MNDLTQKTGMNGTDPRAVKRTTIIAWIVSIVVSLSFLLFIISGLFIFFVIANHGDNSTSDLVISEASTPKDTGLLDNGTSAFVKDGVIEYKNAGSGSCPPVLQKATYDTKTATYVLQVKQYTDQTCTMDYRGIYQTVSRQDGQDIEPSAAIRIV